MSAHEPLREHHAERVGDDPGLDAEVDQAHDRLDRVGGVQRRHHEVPGERRLQRDAGRLGVADLADQDDVGVLAQDRAQPRGEGEPGAHVGLTLGDRLELDLDGVFERDHVDGGRVDELQERVERRCLAGAGGAGRHQKALRLGHQIAHPRQHGRAHAERLEGDQTLAAQDPEHDLLALRARKRRRAQVDASTGWLEGELAVLRYAPLRDIHAREHFDARDDLGAISMAILPCSVIAPSMRKRTCKWSRLGSRWMSLVPYRTARRTSSSRTTTASPSMGPWSGRAGMNEVGMVRWARVS